MIETLMLAAVIAAGPSIKHDAPPVVQHRSSEVMTGPKLPYRGKYWRSHQRKVTLCILKRESNNHWFSTNRANGYFGGFQFSKPLAHGATWMMLPELKQLFGKREGRRIAEKLRTHEMHKWSPFYQHMAFATVYNWQGTAAGRDHWAGGRWSC